MEYGTQAQSGTPQVSPTPTAEASVPQTQAAPETPSYPTQSAITPSEGNSGGGWSFLEGIKLSEIAFGILAVVGILHVINASRYSIKEGKVVNKDLTRRIDAIEQNVISLKTQMQQSHSQPANSFL